MINFGNFRALAAAALLVVSAGVNDAKAVTLDATDVGSSFFVDFNYANTLLVEIEWTLDSIAGNVWNFTVDIANNSSNAPNLNRLTSFGISATPNVSLAITDNDGGLWTAVRTDPTAGYQNIAGGIEDCVTSATGGNPNCQGGGNGGIAGGGSSTMGLALTLLSPSSTLTFDAFAVRFQSINVNGFQSLAFQGTERMPPVPVPAAGLMLLGALGGLAALRRRRKAA